MKSDAFANQGGSASVLRVEDSIYRKGLEALPAHVAIINPRGDILLVNHAWSAFAACEGAGEDFGLSVGANYLAICRKAATHEQLAQRALFGIEAVLNGRVPEFSLEYPCHSPAKRRWFLMTVTPLDGQERVGAVISHVDISERIQAETERRAADARYRTVYENAPLGIAELTPAGRVIFANDRFQRILGYTAAELNSKPASELTHEDDRDTEGAHLEVLRSGQVESFALEKRMRRKDGAFVWVRSTTSCIRGPEDQIDYLVVVIEDISERKEAEARQQTLMHEIAHRNKNLLAVIQAVATHSLRGDGALGDARRGFEGRLQALSRTYDTLTHEAFSGAPLDAVLANELSGFGGRAKFFGPSVMLTVKAAQTFALVIHELATNASKYGALSAAEGRVVAHWDVIEVEGEERLRFEWREEGGPLVSFPQRKGFGSLLIVNVAGAEFGCKPNLSYGPSGFAYSFEARLKKLGSAPLEMGVRAKLKSEVARSLYDEWARHRGASRDLPPLEGFDWSRFAKTGSLAIARVDPDFQVRLVQVGRALVQELGRPLEERELTEEEREGLLDAYRLCARKGEPCHEFLRFDFGDDDPLTFERLIVPFSATSTHKVTHLAAAVLFGGRTRPDAG